MISIFDRIQFGMKDHHIREFFELVRNSQVIVITAPSGSGKSTLLPYRLMVPPPGLPEDLFTRHGQIVVTEPRIQATRALPAFVARELHSSGLGASHDIGFRHRGSPTADLGNKLIYVTDGVLIDMIQREELGALSVIMIDEAHERSLNTDLILGLLKAQLPLYPQLRLIIVSATIDVDLFINFFGGPRIVSYYAFPGAHQYPVEIRFRTGDPIPLQQMPLRIVQEITEKVVTLLQAIEQGDESARGDILVFLHSAKMVEQTCACIRREVGGNAVLQGKVDVFPLYATLPVDGVDAALRVQVGKSGWRVVVSTAIAETSLTLSGAVHVVDSGLINVSQWDPVTLTSYIVTQFHSQAGCRQRWGRVGRHQPGVAHCMYTEEQFAQFVPHSIPDVLRAPLEHVILQAKVAGIEDIASFDWIQAPGEAELSRAPRSLQARGALDSEGDLTEHGLRLALFAQQVDTANLLILADRFGCAVEMATFLSMSEPNAFLELFLWDRGWSASTKHAINRVRERLKKECMDDVEFYLRLWEAWETNGRAIQQREAWVREYAVNERLFRERIAPRREELLGLLAQHKKDHTTRRVNFGILARLRIVLTYGLPDRIYVLANRTMDGGRSIEAAVYRRAMPESGRSPEEIRFEAAADVRISPESVCYGRPTELFVCGNLRRRELHDTPGSESQIGVYASCLSLTKAEWIGCSGMPFISLARLIAAERQGASTG